MDNLKCVISPYRLQYNNESNLQIRLLYKKIMKSTGYQIQKYECKKTFILQNAQAKISDQYQCKINQEMQFNNLKISIIIIASEGRNINFLGDATINLAHYETNCPEQQQIYLPLDKCKDSLGRIDVSIRFHKLKEKRVTIDSRQKYAAIKSNTINQVSEIPSAYEISKRNYKKYTITRNQTQCNKSKQKVNHKNYQSGKKYQNIQKKKNETFHKNTQKEYSISNSNSKSNNSNSNFSKDKKYNKIQNAYKIHKSSNIVKKNDMEIYSKGSKSPKPRLKSPEPIIQKQQTTINRNKQYNIQRNKKKQNCNITNSHIKNNIYERRVPQYEQCSLKQQSTFVNLKDIKPLYTEGNSLMEKSKFQINGKSVQSYNSIDSGKNKYEDITEKLAQIQKKINSEKNNSPEKKQWIYQKHYKIDGGVNSHTFHKLINNNQELQDHQNAPSNSNNVNSSQKTHENSISPTVRKINPQPYQQNSCAKQFNCEEEQMRNRSKIIKQSSYKHIQEQYQNMQRYNEELYRKYRELLRQNEELLEKNFQKQKHCEMILCQQALKHKQQMQSRLIQIKSKQQTIINQKVSVLQEDLKEQKLLIDKLTNLYNKADEQLYCVKSEYEKKILLLSDQIEVLLVKNGQLSCKINQKDREKQQLTMGQNNHNNMREHNFKDQYLSEKKKNVNLEAQIRYAQNELKFCKIRENNLKNEKKSLQYEIDSIVNKSNNSKEMKRKASINRLHQQSNNISMSVKQQNKVLKSEINLLRKQVHQLNGVLQNIIHENDMLQIKRQKICNDESRQILQNNYLALQNKMFAYEEELEKKKVQLADIINIVWNHGDANLIDEIDHGIGIEPN